MINDFLNESVYNKRSVDAVFLVGDLNISSFDGGVINFEHIRRELDLVGAIAPEMLSATAGPGLPPASYDANTNSYTQKLAKKKWKQLPDVEHIDYVMALRNNTNVSVIVSNTIVPIRTAAFGDLSDHHAVLSRAVIRPKSS